MYFGFTAYEEITLVNKQPTQASKNIGEPALLPDPNMDWAVGSCKDVGKS